MRTILALAFVCLAFIPTPVQAQVGPGHFTAWDRYEGRRAVPQQRRTARAGKRQIRTARRSTGRTMQARLSPTVEAVSTTIQTPFGVAVRTVSSMSNVPGEIAGFLRNVASQCGSVRVISTFRRGARVAGRGVMSCHAMGQAVDYTTLNPSCALRVAQGVRLGHSVDYGRVAHFHVSSCAREMGMRFAHGGGRSYARRAGRTRYASRTSYRVRYAQYRRR